MEEVNSREVKFSDEDLLDKEWIINIYMYGIKIEIISKNYGIKFINRNVREGYGYEGKSYITKNNQEYDVSSFIDDSLAISALSGDDAHILPLIKKIDTFCNPNISIVVN